jgi:demethylspheroidene O-methyltransferase
MSLLLRMDSAPLSWMDRALAWRDRLIGSDGFRRWAGRFPLTRPMARRRARALFDLCAGFVYSQVLAACVQLDLFTILSRGPQDAGALARRCGLGEDAMLRLLRAAASLGLVARRSGGRWGLGQLGAAMVDNEGIAAMVEHHRLLYADLADPVRLLREGSASTRLSRFWPYATSTSPATVDPEAAAAYSRVMAASQRLLSNEILDAFPLRRHRVLLDVGGGEGAFVEAVARRHPHLRLKLFDLPAVAERARARLAAAGMSARTEVSGGDFKRDALPAGADVVALIRVMFDHDDETVAGILRNVRRAMAPDATLLVAEPMAGTPGAEPMGDAYFGFYLMAMGRGRSRTVAELQSLLTAAGFGPARLVPTPMPLQTQLLSCRPA